MRTRTVAASRLSAPTSRALALVVVAVLVVAVTVGALRWASAESASGAPTPSAEPVSAMSDGAAGAGATRAPVVRRAAAIATPVPKDPVPVRLRMAGTDIDLRIRSVGVRGDGEMELPDQPWVLGWYRFGPAPGAGRGSAVLAGHLDSKKYGIGPLVGLRDAQRGDPVTVTRSDGATASYRVVEVERYDQQALPAPLFARTGPERLRVITCGGEFDPGAGYEKNLVVTAEPT